MEKIECKLAIECLIRNGMIDLVIFGDDRNLKFTGKCIEDLFEFARLEHNKNVDQKV